MPNWCYNNMDIYGDREDADAFYEELNDWQCEVSDKLSNEADKAYEALLEAK